jgi:mRNA interferase RelE/StbE
MPYTVEFSRNARRELQRLPEDIQARIWDAVVQLEHNPRTRLVEKLKGAANLYRYRVGTYRIVYEVHDDTLIVMLIRIRHRREVYRKR